jgi:hypothetical protein
VPDPLLRLFLRLRPIGIALGGAAVPQYQGDSHSPP